MEAEDHIIDVKNVERFEKKKVSSLGGIENARGGNASAHLTLFTRRKSDVM